MCIRDRFYARMEQDAFNYTCDNMIEAMKCFVTLHYALSQRDGNKYWKDCTDVNFDIDPTWRHSTRTAHGNVVVMLEGMVNAFNNLEQHSGSIYIAVGQGYRPFSNGLYEENKSTNSDLKGHMDTIKDIHTKYQQDRQYLMEWVDNLPSHYEYLRDNIYDLQKEETVG